MLDFNPELGIDYEFVKNIDPKKEVFYMVDGMHHTITIS